MNKKPGVLPRALCALLLITTLLSLTGCSSLLSFLGKSVSNAADATPAATATSAPTAAPEAPEADAPTPAEKPEAPTLTEDELRAVLDDAQAFFIGWFYDRTDKIDPAYSDWSKYPSRTDTGEIPSYPTDAGDIQTYADLLAATEFYFDSAVAVELLESIGAVDMDGRLCVTKNEGLGGVGYKEWLTAVQADDGSYTLSLAYAFVELPDDRQTVTVQCIPTDGRWIFSGDTNDISIFFITLAYSETLEVTVE